MVALAAGVVLVALGPADRVITTIETAHTSSGATKAAAVPKPVLVTTKQSQAALKEASVTRLIITYRHGIPAATSAKVEHALGLRLVRSIPDLHIRVVTAASAGATSTALSALKARAEVQSVETDSVVAPQDELPNNPSFPAQYSVGGGAWGWYMTHVTQAWDVTQGQTAVQIAVLDTGIKPAGLNFSGQIGQTWNTCSTCSAVNTSDVTTNAGNHGTYVAGVIGLAIGDGTGSAGVCPHCRLMIVQVGTDSGAYQSDIAAGLTWAADHGARVANMSWAGTSDSATLQTATTYAHSKGVVMTGAAGNSNCNCVTYPSGDPYVLGVAGVDGTGAKSGDSNFGSWVAVAAPEGDMTAWPSINGGPGYAPVGGTSSAAPFVAGIAGLLFSANTALTAAQVEQALESTAAPVAFTVAHGRVDAMAALASAGFVDPQPAAAAPVSVSAPQVLVETNGDWNYHALTAAPAPGQVLLRGQGAWSGSAPLSLSTVQWMRCDSSGAACALAATAAKYTVQSSDVGSTFYVSAVVANPVGSTAVRSALSLPVSGSTATASPAASPSTMPAPSPTPTIAPSPSPSPSPAPTPSPVATTQTTTFSGSLNSGNPTRTYSLVVGAGSMTARLTFTRCKTLTLALSTGTSATGPSAVVLTGTLAAGTYSYTVSGGKCSFTLTVTAAP